VGPGYSFRHSTAQWVTAVEDDLMVDTYGTRYVMADIDQTTVPIEVRINWTFNPKLSLQAYLQPYLAVGDYYGFKELSKTRTFDFNVFEDSNAAISLDQDTYTVDPDGNGPASPFAFENPDFNFKSLRGTLVLRWEFRPGSTLYCVWTQNRADYQYPGDFSMRRDFRSLFEAPGENIFLLKVTYRFRI